MRNFFLSVVIFFSYLFSSGQNLESNIRWVKVLSGIDLGYPVSLIATDNDGNVFMLSNQEGDLIIDHNFISTSPPSSLTSILKFDSLGNLIFLKHLPNSRYPCGLAIDSLNNIYVSHDSYSTTQTKLLLKLDSMGNIVWKDSLQHPFSSSPIDNELTVDSIGNLYLGATNDLPGSVFFNSDSLFSDSMGVTTFFLLKIDPNGQLTQSKFFQDNYLGYSVCWLSGLRFNNYDNNLIIFGSTSASGLQVGSSIQDTVEQGAFLLKYDPNLQFIDKYSFQNYTPNRSYINFDRFNNVYLSFNSYSEIIIEDDTLIAGNMSGAIIKFDNELNHSWHKYLQNGYQSFETSSCNASGSIYLTITHSDSIASKLSSEGDLRWNFILTDAAIGNGNKKIACGKSNKVYGTFDIVDSVLINGHAYFPDNSFSVLLYLMNDPDSLVAIEEYEKLNLTVFPNPSNTEINILSLESMIESIEICNLLGDRIEFMEVGGFNKTIDSRFYVPGFYFLTIQTNRGKAVKKVLIQ